MNSARYRIRQHIERTDSLLLQCFRGLAVQARAIRDTGLRKFKSIEKTVNWDFNPLYKKPAAGFCAIFN